MDFLSQFLSPYDNDAGRQMASMGLHNSSYSPLGTQQEEGRYQSTRESTNGIMQLMNALLGMGMYTGSNAMKQQHGNMNQAPEYGNSDPWIQRMLSPANVGNGSTPTGPGGPNYNREMQRTGAPNYMFGGQRYGFRTGIPMGETEGPLSPFSGPVGPRQRAQFEPQHFDWQGWANSGPIKQHRASLMNWNRLQQMEQANGLDGMGGLNQNYRPQQGPNPVNPAYNPYGGG